MNSYAIPGALVAFLVMPGAVHAQDEVSPSVPMKHRSQETLELRLGVAGGGPIGLLAPVAGVDRLTTEKGTGVVYLRTRLPRHSSRVLELYGVFPNGVGVNLKNDDFRLGNFRFSLLDIGVFWNARRPVSVRRVDRKLDLTFGTSVEYHFGRRWAISMDYRVFLPANVFRMLTDYGDFARLIGREALQGGQLWGGFSYSW